MNKKRATFKLIRDHNLRNMKIQYLKIVKARIERLKWDINLNLINT